MALALFVAEAFVVSYGALTVAGAICLALGGLMLVDSPAGFQRVSLAVVAPVALATAAVAFLLVGGNTNNTTVAFPIPIDLFGALRQASGDGHVGGQHAEARYG